MGILNKLLNYIGFNKSTECVVIDTGEFERVYTKYWLAYQCRLDDVVMPYVDDNGEYIVYNVGDVVPVIKIGDAVAYYRIDDISKYGSSVGDYAFWDDRKEYMLVFVYIKISEENHIIFDYTEIIEEE